MNSEGRDPIVLGIVGPIGSGKTLVLEMLRDLGAETIAADDISRELLQPRSPVLEEVFRRFGRNLRRPDGRLDRAALADQVFADEGLRRRLNALLHPLMVQRLRRQLEQWRQCAQPPTIVAVEAAILDEMDARPLVDHVVRVEAPRDQRLRRLGAREGMNPQQAEQRLRLHEQMGLAQVSADSVIDNSGDLAALRKQVVRLWSALEREHRRRPGSG